ncbi:hypothetical protein, partial [Vibrio echinoideorum]
QWAKSLYDDCRAANEASFEMPEFGEFWENGFLDFGKGKPWTRPASFREDTEINALRTPSGFIEITSRTGGNM